MTKNRLCVSLFLVFGAIVCSNAQLYVPETQQDSTSALIYKDIYEFSQRDKFYTTLYRLFFRKPETAQKTVAAPKHQQTMYEDAEGKVIRNVIVMTQSPFDVTDSVNFFSQQTVDKIANALHINTQAFVIRNLLMFKKNDVLDSLVVQESERLLRSRQYIDRTRIIVKLVAENSDSVDVIVQVHDNFSLAFDGELSSSAFGIGLRERNFFGLGHQAQVAYKWSFDNALDNYQYNYTMPNILGTYISVNTTYRWRPVDSSEVKRFSLNRPFYSPLARWAGGADVMQRTKQDFVYVPFADSLVLQPFRYNVYDFWGAYAIKFKKRSVKARNRNIILSTRYYHIDYLTKPLPEYDPYNMYCRENLYLFGIGFSERGYHRDSHLFRFGWTEDVPVGQVYNFVAGVQNKNSKNRPYFALQTAYGKYFGTGYYGYGLEYGSFFHNKNIEEGTAKVELNYFTPLLEFSAWKFRQFAKVQAMFGINRLPTERLSLSSYYGITGFNSKGISGMHKYVATFQSQFYTPWNLWGFRFAPYIVYSAGMLGDDRNGFSHSRLYSLFGAGILFRNDHLIFNSFEFSISFFPYLPNDEYNFYKFNSYSASDFSLRDFDIGKPEKIIYE